MLHHTSRPTPSTCPADVYREDIGGGAGGEGKPKVGLGRVRYIISRSFLFGVPYREKGRSEESSQVPSTSYVGSIRDRSHGGGDPGEAQAKHRLKLLHMLSWTLAGQGRELTSRSKTCCPRSTFPPSSAQRDTQASSRVANLIH